MNISRKILIDRIAGKPAAFCLNLAARLLAKLYKRNHALHSGFNRIVVCKFVGMGSVLQLTPLIRTLRANFPQVRIAFVTSEANREIVDRLGLVDQIIAVNDSGMMSMAVSSARALLALWRFKAEAYLDFEIYSNFSSILATLSCAKNRIGYFKSSFAYRSGMYNYLVFFNMKAPVADVYLHIARLLKCETMVRELYPVPVGDEDRAALKLKLPLSPGEKYIVLNPNASELRVERRWDADCYAKLMERLSAAYPRIKLVVTGSRSEAPYVASVLDKVAAAGRKNIMDLSGQLTLGALFALIEGAELLISNDTGPMHIAFALKKKSVTLWGPGHPLHYGSAESSLSIYKNLYCSPCIYEFDIPPCKGDNQCMKAITVDEVFAAVGSVLENRAAFKTGEGPTMVFSGPQSGRPLGIVVK
jgi:ADP-heptose:LPS heptosyltransferase